MQEIEIQETNRPETDEPSESEWSFDEGDAIAPGLTALKLLGGGSRYEAYLAWSERMRTLVVVKLVRPAWSRTPAPCAASPRRSRCSTPSTIR